MALLYHEPAKIKAPAPFGGRGAGRVALDLGSHERYGKYEAERAKEHELSVDLAIEWDRGLFGLSEIKMRGHGFLPKLTSTTIHPKRSCAIQAPQARLMLVY